MKDVITKTFLIVLTIGLFYFIFLRECKHREECPPKGYELFSNEFVDSLIAEANKPPVIIIKDSIVYRDTIIYIIKTIPEPTIDPSTELNIYLDSIYNDSIRVWTELHVDGTVHWWDQWYQPIVHYKTITKEIKVPYPVTEKIYYNRDALYVSGLAGAMGTEFAYGVGIDYVTGNKLYGLQYNRIGSSNVFQGKLGFKIGLRNERQR